MPIHTVIQERRKALNLTQEQVAEYLGVTAPAVNKWEKGATCPDFSLLAPLARLLKTDLNTLLCFQEELTKQEIDRFSNELSEVFKEKGVDAGVEKAKELLQEYPNCESMRHMFALILEGFLVMSALTPEQRKPYEEILISWYEHVAENGEDDLRNNAAYMLTSKYLQRDELEKAQEMLELLPEPSALDKRILQAHIYQRQKRPEEAAKLLERVILGDVNMLHNMLVQLSCLEQEAGESLRAEQLAEISTQAAELFHLWGYSPLLARLELAVAKKREEESICLLRQMLEALFKPWNMFDSPLYRRISPGTRRETREELLPPLLMSLEQDPRFDFLRENQEFREILETYHEKCRKTKRGEP